MKILLLTTRRPDGRPSGRKTVLTTMLRALDQLGHAVRVVAITDEPVPPDADASIVTVRPPGLPRILLNAATGVPMGRRCLNECLYDSPVVRRTVVQHCDEFGADLVIADMIRTAEVASATARPVVLDLDDLLSDRYRALSKGRADRSNILGYYGRAMPRPLRSALARFAVLGLALEARLVGRRELATARMASAVSLVSKAEADRFARRIGREVRWLPMAVPIPTTAATVATNAPGRIVFVGGLDYHANLEAVRWYVREIRPVLQQRGLDHLRLRVVGHCPDEVRHTLSADAVELVGFVDDLGAELASARAFVAPIQPGTGVKTKVVEAMAAGLPVVSTEYGVTGLATVDGEHFLLGATPEQFVDALELLVTDGARAAAIGAAARALVERDYAPDAALARWRSVLAALEVVS
jgi:glycosyltransferase involved in cell wall biosynthesis